MSHFLAPGSIVWATIVDPNGHNPKLRPVVIVRVLQDQPGLYFVCAVTSTFSRPLAVYELELPYSQDPHVKAKTGLTRPSIVKLNWSHIIGESMIQSSLGRVPHSILQLIFKQFP